MGKFIVLCTKCIAVTMLVALFASCHTRIDLGNGIDGSGNVTKQTRNVDNNFSKIVVNRGLNVTLEQGDSYWVEVEADDNLQEHITTRVENGMLTITADDDINGNATKNIHVRLPSLSAIEVNGGSSVSSKNTLNGTDIVVKTSGGSEAELRLEYDKIDCETTSGSSLNLKGKALELKTAASSGSSIEARDLLVNDVIAEASSGSSTEVHPGISLNAKASSGSSIDYNGSPKTVSKEESSGGSVSKE
ncbi:head GIN domain-containing protein [Flavobacterium sp.]|uniref:head GIN domain-containing protein n=2 Tax=Flavobacterium sp. TaxID=239 RepID=UPI002FDADA4A